MNTDKTYAEAIASEYAPKETSKVSALKKLDNLAKRPARIFSYTFGSLMAMLLGLGLCFAMGAIGDGSSSNIILGTIIGVAGMAGAGVNYILYNKLLEKGKKKYTFEIMELAKEISANAE